MTLQNILNEASSYELGIAQMLVTRNMTNLQNHILKGYDLSTAEWFVLGTVYQNRERGIRVTDLAIIFDVKTTYITALLNGLRQKAYVTTETNPRDARVRLIVTTEKGDHDVPAIEEELKSATGMLFENRVTAEQLANYLHVLREMGTTNSAS